MIIGKVNAQQDPQYSQYMFTQMAYNPGYAGINDMVSLTGDSRLQWTGFTGRPQTNTFTADAAVKPFGIESGIGVLILNDNIGNGVQANIGLSAVYSYKMSLGAGKLGLGVKLGFVNSAFDGSKLQAAQTESFASGQANKFDNGIGVFYKDDKIYFGMSVNHLVSNNWTYNSKGSSGSDGNAVTIIMVPNYYVTSGYTYQLPSNPLYEIVPSFIVEYGGVPQLSLNTNVVYNKKVWGGISYRANALTAMIGFELQNGLRIGYSYDYELSQIQSYSGGSHEIMINYNFKLNREIIPQKYKSVRFL